METLDHCETVAEALDLVNEALRLTALGRAVVKNRKEDAAKNPPGRWFMLKRWFMHHLYAYDEATIEIAGAAAQEIVALRARIAELEAELARLKGN